MNGILKKIVIPLAILPLVAKEKCGGSVREGIAMLALFLIEPMVMVAHIVQTTRC